MNDTYNRKCLTCGREFETNRRNYHYCCFACYQRKAYKERTCQYCGNSYGGPYWKKYCSGECRGKHALEEALANTSTAIKELGSAKEANISTLAAFPFIPRFIALFTGASDPMSSRLLQATSKEEDLENVAKYVCAINRGPKSYQEICQAMSSTKNQLKAKNSEIVRDFEADAGAFLRRGIKASAGEDFDGSAIRTNRDFQTGMTRIQMISRFMNDETFRRCTSCHLAGSASTHFRKVKVGDKWGYSEFCIYCDPSTWSQGFFAAGSNRA